MDWKQRAFNLQLNMLETADYMARRAGLDPSNPVVRPRIYDEILETPRSYIAIDSPEARELEANLSRLGYVYTHRGLDALRDHVNANDKKSYLVK